ncbi:MAG: deoxyribose-phosphate aldolase [Christensenellaceae bacterium]|nr:deoxyribose-phosphate aldolase [Christensenellaceae bacterium]
MANIKEKGYDANYAQYCDHTVLRAYTTTDTVREFCEEAKEYNAAAVCVNPIHVALVHECLKGSNVKTATVIGFPLGANKPCIKAMEAAEAIKDGADEVDMVINIGALREGNYELVLEDIKGVVEAAKGKAGVKVIIETCYLTNEQKVKASELCMEAGADFVKTSTGMGNGGATVHDIELIRATVGDKMHVKASGDVADRATAFAMINAGADRLGVSRVPQIVNDDTEMTSASKRNQPPKPVGK